MKRTIFLLSITIAACSIAANAEKTTRHNLKAPTIKTTTSTNVTERDTIDNPSETQVCVSGYDKPLRSRLETMFVTNKTADTIKSISLHLTYYDKSGRQLHRSNQTITCEIPTGETQQIQFKSWDRQFTFYYHLSPRPRNTAGTPFKTKCIVTRIITSSKNPLNNATPD